MKCDIPKVIVGGFAAAALWITPAVVCGVIGEANEAAAYSTIIHGPCGNKGISDYFKTADKFKDYSASILSFGFVETPIDRSEGRPEGYKY